MILGAGYLNNGLRLSFIISRQQINSNELLIIFAMGAQLSLRSPVHDYDRNRCAKLQNDRDAQS
jgi:hypothetical protein